MKVLLIQPPVEDFYHTVIRTYPLGLAYVAASVREAGYSVAILDCHTPGKKTTIPIPKEFRYMEQYYVPGNVSPFKLFSHYYHFGLSWNEIRECVRISGATVFGISAAFTPYYGMAQKVARIIKEVVPAAVVIMGGAHVTCCPEPVLCDQYVDYVVLGEGEIRMPHLLQHIQDGTLPTIDGVGYKDGEQCIINPLMRFLPDIDKLPYPAYDLLEGALYTIGTKRYAMMLTSRGCPQQCTFCSVHATLGRQYRARTPEHIVAEMKMLHTLHGVEVFDFEDDNFTWDTHRAVRILTLIKDHFPRGTIQIIAMNGLSFHAITDELFDALMQVGFSQINIAPVTHVEKKNRLLQRPKAETSFENGVAKAVARGMTVTAYLILGLPNDDCPTMMGSIIALMKEQVLLGPSIFYPTPGTVLYEQLACEGRVCKNNFSQYRSSLFSIETPAFRRVDMVTLFHLVRMINFIKELLDAGQRETYASLSQLCAEYVGVMVNAVAVDDAEVSIDVVHAINHRALGALLLVLFLKRQTVYEVRYVKKKKTGKIRYMFTKAAVSEDILATFCRMSKGCVIRGCRKKTSVIVDWLIFQS